MALKISKEDQVTLNLDSFYINLIVIQEELECYELMHLMQFNQILFYIEEDNILRSKLGFKDSRYAMGYSKKDNWPFLIVDSSSEQINSTSLQGKESIIQYFQEQKIMGEVKNYSVYEKQGLEWIEETAIPAYNLLKSTFRGRFQYSFTSKNFRYGKIQYEGSRIISAYLWKILKTFYFYFKDTSLRREYKDLLKHRYQRMHDVFDEWEERLSNESYHGGNSPDAADFKMFSLAYSHNHMFCIQKLLKSRGDEDQKFLVWYKKMNNGCRNIFTEATKYT
jgi:hypothetical protein